MTWLARSQLAARQAASPPSQCASQVTYPSVPTPHTLHMLTLIPRAPHAHTHTSRYLTSISCRGLDEVPLLLHLIQLQDGSQMRVRLAAGVCGGNQGRLLLGTRRVVSYSATATYTLATATFHSSCYCCLPMTYRSILVRPNIGPAQQQPLQQCTIKELGNIPVSGL